MVYGVAWRMLIAAVVSDQLSRRVFVNYVALRKHKMAEYEVKKIMRTWDSPKPHVPLHKRANSYVWC